MKQATQGDCDHLFEQIDELLVSQVGLSEQLVVDMQEQRDEALRQCRLGNYAEACRILRRAGELLQAGAPEPE